MSSAVEQGPREGSAEKRSYQKQELRELKRMMLRAYTGEMIDDTYGRNSDAISVLDYTCPKCKKFNNCQWPNNTSGCWCIPLDKRKVCVPGDPMSRACSCEECM